MTIGGKYGNLKKNEASSTFITQEDIEKRRLDRERSRKLSLETNRRRKALEEKKRLAAEREKKKIDAELNKRHLKQTEATERYQRSHLSARSDRRPKTAYTRGIPSLDNILQQLRSGCTEINYGFNNDSTCSSISTGRLKLENKVNEQQNALLEKHRIKTRQEFQNEIHKPYLLKNPKLETENKFAYHITENTSPPVPAAGYTNADLLKVQTKQQGALTDSLSRLFIRNRVYNRPNYELPQTFNQQNLSSTNQKEDEKEKDEEVFQDISDLDDKKSEEVDLLDSLDMKNNSIEEMRLSIITSDSTFSEDSLHGNTRDLESPTTLPQSTSDHKTLPTTSLSDLSTDTTKNTSKSAPDFQINKISDEKPKWEDDSYYIKSYRPRTPTVRDTRSKNLQNNLESESIFYPSAGKPPEATEISLAYMSETSTPKASQGPKVQFNKEKTSEPVPEVSPAHIEGDGITETKKQPRGILKKISKYACEVPSYPIYHSAATIARQQWVSPILKHKSDFKLHQNSIKTSKLTSSKSVKWNEIQYDDGTSATILESGQVISNQDPSTVHSTSSLIPQKSSNLKSGGVKGKGRGKGKGSAVSVKGKKGGKAAAGGKGRTLKPVKDPDLPLEPHPPIGKKQKELSMSSVLHYSIHDENLPTSTNSAPNLPLHSKVAWKEPDNGVTLDNLKSSGEVGSQVEEKRIKDEVMSTERSGNHVTIHIVSNNNQKKIEETINLSKTPTDQEINRLWENVRECISSRSNHRTNVNKTTNKNNADNQRFGLHPSARAANRSGWSIQPNVQQQPNIVSIDGGIFTSDLGRGNNQFRMNAQTRKNFRLSRPHSAVASTPGCTNETYNVHSRQQNLLRQRRQKSYLPQGGIREMATPNFKRYPVVTPSVQLPYAQKLTPREDPRSSTTAFLFAEALAEQNMSEEEILIAMESLQKKSAEAQKHGRQINPSALSIEEQRLLASLDRLNSRLEDIESAVSTNPNVSFFNKQLPLPQNQMNNIRRFHRNNSATDLRHQRFRDYY